MRTHLIEVKDFSISTLSVKTKDSILEISQVFKGHVASSKLPQNGYYQYLIIAVACKMKFI